MKKETFEAQLQNATRLAFQFGQRFFAEQLPSEVKYVAALNCSYDKNATDAKVYPEDKGRVETDLTENQVVDLLFREERCPVWIDIAVLAANSSYTLMSLTCAGRYHEEEGRLYYFQQGTHPFGIKSPVLPPGYQQGGKLKLLEPSEASNTFCERRKR